MLPADRWKLFLDARADQANDDMERAKKRCVGQSDYGVGAALIAIASQLAYGNAVAAARFYMEYLNEEKP